ncbi:MAG TPA: glutaredoxin family protein [Phycisphaerae bacterium]|nr:glutaredoxin family protein [Phycisphaerales bacterium]HRX83529.1 glutaredoxin family protein [Phycisphaerae bacterium]
MLTFFTKPECSLCDAAWFVVQKVASAQGVPVEKVDISQPQAEAWRQRYAEHIPVVHLDGVEIFRHRVDERKLRKMLANRPSD